MPSPIAFVTYLRKSQEADDRQILSMPAQASECIAKFPELIVLRTIQESMSAKAPGRPLLNELLDQVESGMVQGVIAWHPDRLSRNSVDAGRIIYLLDTGKLKELKFCTYTFENTPEGKWMLSMIMSQAKYHVDKLSVDVKRGNRQKYERGGISWNACQGYLHNYELKTIEVDPHRFPVVRKMWELLLSGSYTVPQIQRVANRDWGYRTRPSGKKLGNRPICLAVLYRMFRNSLYCSLNLRDGATYECSHPPMLTQEEFWRAQEILGRRGRPKPKRPTPSPYTDSLIHCGECGGSITVETKVKRFKNGNVRSWEYYRCTKKRGPCSQRYLERKALDEQLGALIAAIVPSAACYEWVKAHLKVLAAADVTTQTEVTSRSRMRTLESVSGELANLTTMRRKEQIEEGEFIEQRNELLAERARLQSRAGQTNRADAWLGPAIKTFEFGYRCLYWFWHGDEMDRKTIITTIAGSDLRLLDKVVHFQPVAPFQFMAWQDGNDGWCG